MKRQTICALLTAFILTAGAATSAVQAQTNIFVPKLELDLRTRYNDNLLLSPDFRERDWSFVATPTVGLLYGQRSRTYVSAEYACELEKFATLSKYDTANHFVEFDSRAQFDRAAIRVAHSFHDVSGPNSEVSSWMHDIRNVTYVDSEYRFNDKTSVGLDYRQEFHEYPTTGWIDYQQYAIGGTLYYRLFPKTDLLCQFNHGWVDMARGEDATYQEVNLGLRGQLTSKVNGRMTVGYQHREFNGVLPAWNEPVAAVGLDAQFTERTGAALTVARKINPSVALENRSYASTIVDFTVRQRILRTVMLTAGGLYETRDYNLTTGATGRLAEQWETRIGVVYDMTKWLRLGASYRYRSADFTGADRLATQNFVSINATIHY